VKASLVVAARQVEQTREQLLLAEKGRLEDPTITLNTLNALNTLLAANNALIASWVSYQQLRVQLLLDLEALELDERGLYRDDQNIDLRRDRGEAAGQPAGEPALQPARP
jgi:hypothetical protein